MRDKPFREVRDIRKLGYLVSRKSLKRAGHRAQLAGGCETGAEVSLAKPEAGLGVKLTCFSPFC